MAHRISIAAFTTALIAAGVVLPSPADAAGITVSVRPARAVEGRALAFAVTLSRPSRKVVTVDFATMEGSANDSNDFVARAGTLRFRPKQRARRVDVAVNTDQQDEPEESMSLVLSQPTRARLGRHVAEGTIEDIDDPPAVSIADTSASEGDDLNFDVTLSAASGHAITVEVATDTYVGTVTFEPGQTSQVQSVATTEDQDVEPDETITAVLSDPENASLGDAQATGTIVDDDVELPSISAGDTSASEGSSGSTTSLRFPVTLSAPSTDLVTVDFTTIEQTATGADDYAASEGTVRFLPGDTQATVSVPVNGDDLDEEDEETLAVELNSPTNATIEDGEGIGAIIDDDATPAMSVNDVLKREYDAGLTDLVFTVTLSTASGRTVTASYATANRSAHAPSDYHSVSGEVTFEPGTMTRLIRVPVVGDRRVEGREIFVIDLSDSINATLGKSQGLGKIFDDD
jgi:urease beta subunit